MTTQPTLPEWTGDLEHSCSLAVGDLRARAKRTNHIIKTWTAHVWRNDEPRWLFASTKSLSGEIFRGDMARAICEAIIRQALRADEAEAEVDELRGALDSVEMTVRGLRCKRCFDGVARTDDGRLHVCGNKSVRCKAYSVDDPRPIEDVIEELAAEVPPGDWAKVDPSRLGENVVVNPRAGSADWDRMRQLARDHLGVAVANAFFDTLESKMDEEESA